MIRTTWMLLRIITNPRIMRTPLRVMRELQRRGTPRLGSVMDAHRVQRRRLLPFLRTWLRTELLSRHRGQWVVNSFVPPFPGAAFNRLFENALSGRRLSPVSAYLGITADCPYHCWHCSARNRRTGALSTQHWLSVIAELHALGCSMIGFTGGEPFARADLPQLVHAAAAGGATTIVFTSGALASARRLAALRAAGLWGLCVSVDHPDPAEHDRLRGAPGAFARAHNCVRRARAAGFYTMIGTVATRAHIEDNLLARLYDLARAWRAHELRIVEPMPCGLLHDADAGTLLTPAQVDAVRAFHVAINRAGRLPKVCAFNQIESPELFGCGGGTQHLYIDSAGAVCPCDFTPMSFGNVSTTPLAQIWARMSTAMHAPRRHCFIQAHHALINAHLHDGMPLEPDVSAAVCARVPAGDLPDYYAAIAAALPAPSSPSATGPCPCTPAMSK